MCFACYQAVSEGGDGWIEGEGFGRHDAGGCGCGDERSGDF